MSSNEKEYLDYWYEYPRHICFPKTANTTRKIGDFLLHSCVTDANYPTRYEFWYRYDGIDQELKTNFDTAVQNKKSYHYNYHNNKKSYLVDGKEFLYYTTVNFNKNKNPSYIYNKDFIRAAEYALFHYTGGKRPINVEFVNFSKLLDKDNKNYRKIRKTQFQEKFGKTIEDYMQEREDEKEQQKSIVYTTLVGEAYTTLERLRDECNILMNGLQDGRHGYKLDTYKAFRNEILAYNKYLGYRNEFIKGQIKNGGLRQQTLLMFLRDNAKKPAKKK